MPLVRIEILKGKDDLYKRTLLDAVHDALVNALGIAEWDRFQRLYELEEACFQRSESKTDRFTMIEITMFPGRTREQKAQVFSQIVQLLNQRLGIAAEDVFIVIQEPSNENWGLAGIQRGE